MARTPLGVECTMMERNLSTLQEHADALDEAMIPILRAKSGVERLRMLNGMFRSARQIVEYSIRAAHPDWMPVEVQREIARKISHGAIAV